MAILILGGGNMGAALAKGLHQAQNKIQKEIYVCDPNPQQLEVFKGTHIKTISQLHECPSFEVLVLAVKPQVFPQIAPSIAKAIQSNTHIVSLMAGFSVEKLRQFLPSGIVVRTMPNLPLTVGEGITAIAIDQHSESSLTLVENLFLTVGKVVRVQENQMDAVTALSGSGPMYGFELVKGLILAGIHQGLSESLASELTLQTLKGALRLLENGEKPGNWTLKVCSPGGTTIHALKALESHHFYESLFEAVDAATKRSKELGK